MVVMPGQTENFAGRPRKIVPEPEDDCFGARKLTPGRTRIWCRISHSEGLKVRNGAGAAISMELAGPSEGAITSV